MKNFTTGDSSPTYSVGALCRAISSISKYHKLSDATLSGYLEISPKKRGDNKDIKEAIKLLEGADYQVIEAGIEMLTGGEAVQKIEKEGGLVLSVEEALEHQAMQSLLSDDQRAQIEQMKDNLKRKAIAE